MTSWETTRFSRRFVFYGVRYTVPASSECQYMKLTKTTQKCNVKYIEFWEQLPLYRHAADIS
jgi:hypothetical protein